MLFFIGKTINIFSWSVFFRNLKQEK